MKTQTISKEQKIVNRITLVVTIVFGTGAILYFARAIQIVHPHIF